MKIASAPILKSSTEPPSGDEVQSGALGGTKGCNHSDFPSGFGMGDYPVPGVHIQLPKILLPKAIILVQS